MAIATVNPATGKLVKEFQEDGDKTISLKIEAAEAAFSNWKKTSFAERKKLALKVAEILRKSKLEYAELITLEMGKPLAESEAEVEKCAVAFEYYANETERLLAPEKIETEFSASYAKFEPLGIILAVMPWNFPFWQVLRFAATALMGGNVALLKHASNVPQTALKIEEIFTEAGYPKGVFQTLLIGSSKVEKIVRDWRVRGVSLTGSEFAGREVAKVAAEELKPTVLELGGSDPFIVLNDADLELTVPQAVFSRLRNAGQSCISGKRMIVEAGIYDDFLNAYKRAFEEIVVGDPMDPKTSLGPVSSERSLLDLERQVNRAVEQGAKVITGGKRLDRPGFFFAPTILTGVDESFDIYLEEVFGPIAVVYRAESLDEAIKLANVTSFGLGSSIWTKDVRRAEEEIVPQIEAGSVYINKMMSSDPRMPFGGVKNSGYGRELSGYGIKEFQNIKSVIIP